MKLVTRVPDHVEQGLDLLLGQFQDKPRMAGWAKAYLRQVQLFDDAVYDVIIRRMIDRAGGAQLEVIGRIVGQARQERLDPHYKRFINARIRINRSKGYAQDIYDVLAILEKTPYIIDEYPPAGMYVEFSEEPVEPAPILLQMLQDAAAGGVWFGMAIPTAPVESRFLWSSVGEEDSPDNGFGDANVDDDYGLLSDAVIPAS